MAGPLGLVPIVVSADALRATALGTAALFLRGSVVHSLEGKVRIALGAHPVEDSAVIGKQQFGHRRQDCSAEELDTYRRYKRVLANELENIPLAHTAMWGALLCNGNPRAHAIATGVFVAARVIFDIAYIKKLQPLRSISFMISQGALFALIANGLHGLGFF
mmetsp:Transcript_20968/g.53122  ORF Transcript_20968/g.53122 Transcript_20968/m.53122 type:complete len:162 (+) Transcript_20968:532-1017(+)